MTSTRAFASALFAAAMLAGCAREDAAYPSLAVRAAERQGFAEPAVAPPAPLVADPALDARLAELAGRLNAIVKGYDADAARARAAVGSSGARKVGSEGWIAAQGALAALDDWRAQAGGLASELDALARERAETIGAAYPALDALRQRADAESTREAAEIEAIGSALPTA